jgi:molybdopterin/thiamine biosynthesis adenylyltransferase
MIGTGGIGAAASIALAKMGIDRFHLVDPDTVEFVNIPTQLLRHSDVGKPKVESVANIMKQLSDTVSGTMAMERIDENNTLREDIIISSVDSIDARKAIWEAVLKSESRWYLEARMGAEVFQLYTVNTGDPDWYSGHLSTLQDDEIADDPCTAKATIYTAFIAAGHIAHQVKRILMDQQLPRVLIHDIRNNQLVLPGGMT